MTGIKIGNLSIPAIKGEDGKAGIIKEIKINMLEPGAEPTVKNKGTETEAILEIGIPREKIEVITNEEIEDIFNESEDEESI